MLTITTRAVFNAGICTVNLNHFVINEFHFDFDAFEEQVELDQLRIRVNQLVTFKWCFAFCLLSVISHNRFEFRSNSI